MRIGHTGKLLLVGLFSGLLSYFSNYLPLLDALNWGKLSVNAGFIFGVVIATYFFFLLKYKSIWKLLFWVAASTISYYAAVQTTFHFPSYSINSYSEELGLIIGLIAGGIVGSLLILFSFRYFLFPLTVKQVAGLTLLGGVLSLSWYIIPDHMFFTPKPSEVEAGEKLLSLYLFWQMGMAAALGWAIDASKKM